MTLKERFDAKIDYEPNTGCWLWSAALTPKGYGQIRNNGVTMYAHRVSWELHNGPIGDGLHVLHRCDTPPCVNPDHLFLGTNRDNLLDASRKGRTARGESHGMSRLTVEQVQEIRTSTASGASLSRRYGVGQASISRVRRREDWAWLPDPATTG